MNQVSSLCVGPGIYEKILQELLENIFTIIILNASL